MELLVCYEDEGVYVNTYGRITKDVVLQWGEMPTSVGMDHSEETVVKVALTLNTTYVHYANFTYVRTF